jgi:hypothetical protein
MAYVHQAHRGSGAGYGGPQYGSAGGPPPFAPQYPPPAHNGLNSPYVYDPSSGFAQVRGDLLFLLSKYLTDALDALLFS